MTDITLRPYQIDAKRGAYREFRGGARASLIVMATGLGKSVVAASIVADAIERSKRVLLIAHREELLDQLAAKIRAIAGVDVAIEQGTRKEATADSPVVVGSVLSMVRRLDRFPPDRFDLVIVDECHHSLSATHRQVQDHFTGAKILGFTATPNRGDERALAQVFETVAYDMTTADAIMAGWLVPFRTVTVPLRNLDLSQVRRRSGDLATGELGAVMSETSVLREAIVPAVEMAGTKRAFVFAVTVAHMHAIASTVREVAEERRIDLTVATVDGTTPTETRRKIFDDFRSGAIRWLVNVGVATEGTDVPGAEAVIMLRPTLSRCLYIQMRGRGGRPLPGVVDGVTADSMMVALDQAMATGEQPDPLGWEARASAEVFHGSDAAARRLAIARSAKPECLVLDFTDNSRRHDLASEMDLLGGDYELPEQREAERLIAAGVTANLLDALERARAARRARLRERQARAGDPFALFGLDSRRDRYGREPTPKHRKILDPLALPLPDIDWRMANDLCAELARREAEGLSLYHQAALLARLGCPVGWLPEMTRREASRVVQAIALDSWRRPDWSTLRGGMSPTGGA